MPDIHKGSDVADVYAEALLDLARQAGRVDEVRAELEALVQLTEAHAEFRAFLSSSSVDDDAREASLERMFRGRLSDVLVDTLQIMNRHGRVAFLPQLLRMYVLRVEDARGQVEVTATSAVPLEPPLRQQVTELAERLSGKKPLVEFVVAPEVLGGLMLEIGDHRFDNTLRYHLEQARERLLTRSERGIRLASAG